MARPEAETPRSRTVRRIGRIGTVLLTLVLIGGALGGGRAAAGPVGIVGSGGIPDDPDPAELREQAREILDGDEFQPRSLPKPFRGPLRWIGEQLERLYAPVRRLLEPIVGKSAVPWVVMGIAAIGVAVLAHHFVRSRSRAEIVRRDRQALLLDPDRDPDELETDADRAEVSGDHDTAIRLRHEAGLLRLVRARRLDLRPETTARGAARAVDDPILDELTGLFEAVVYGDRHATAADCTTARDGWSRVLSRSPRRAPTGTPSSARSTRSDETTDRP